MGNSDETFAGSGFSDLSVRATYVFPEGQTIQSLSFIRPAHSALRVLFSSLEVLTAIVLVTVPDSFMKCTYS